MRNILASKIEKSFNGSSRALGRTLAFTIKPGDIVNFSGFSTVDNSFADEFIWRFFENNSAEAIDSLEMSGSTPLLSRLIQRAIERRVLNVPISSTPNPEINWKSIEFFSEFAHN